MLIKSAKEMFEELGFKYKENGALIEYEIGEEEYFVFNKNVKRIYIGNYHIKINELKAINQQCKELGWLE